VIVKTERVYVPVAERPPPPPWRFGTGAFATAGVGVMPSASLGVTVTAWLEPPGFWTIEGFGTYWFDQSVAAERGAGTSVALAYGGVALCPLRWVDGRAATHGSKHTMRASARGRSRRAEGRYK
jgi:hypothetical protein